jgi:hypothetical protein
VTLVIVKTRLELDMSENQVKVTDWTGASAYIPCNLESTTPSPSGKTFKVGFQVIKQGDYTISVVVYKKRSLHPEV